MSSNDVALLHLFQYLELPDLLRAACVNSRWEFNSKASVLWRTVRLNNVQVNNFEAMADMMSERGTVHLDLRKMQLPSNGDDIWPDFLRAIARITTLRKIEFCRCPASVLENLPMSNPNLEVINALTIESKKICLNSFRSMSALKELRLKPIRTIRINCHINLKMLNILSLTAVMNLRKEDYSSIGEITNLESLDLGYCLNFPDSFGRDTLLKLNKLKRLRLEMLWATNAAYLLKYIKCMNNLEQLELIDFDVMPGFDKALKLCKNIKMLMIIPSRQSAQSILLISMLTTCLPRLEGTLTHFVWGIPLEVLSVHRKNKDDDLPMPDFNEIVKQSAGYPSLTNMQIIFSQELPNIRVKILPISFERLGI